MIPTSRLWLLLLVALAACSEAAGPANPPPPPPPPPPPDSGRANVQITGKVTHRGAWYAFGEFRDLLAADTGELSLLGGTSMDTLVARNLTLIFPGRLDAGTFSVGRYIYGTIPNQPAAFITIDTSFFASIPGGSVTITSASYPPRPGLEPGLMQGTLTFHAVRLTAGPPGSGSVETNDTIAVSMTFNAHWAHYLRPNVSVTVTDGPVAGSSLKIVAQSLDDDHGGRLVDWEADLDGLPGQSIPYEISQEFRVAAPALGTVNLSAVTPGSVATPAQWPAAWTALYYRDDPRIALSTGGTLTITKFLPPTDAYYGEIQGMLESRIALWTDATTVSGDTALVSAQFAVQLYPLGGIPASRGIGRDGQFDLVARHDGDRFGDRIAPRANRMELKPHLR